MLPCSWPHALPCAAAALPPSFTTPFAVSLPSLYPLKEGGSVRSLHLQRPANELPPAAPPTATFQAELPTIKNQSVDYRVICFFWRQDTTTNHKARSIEGMSKSRDTGRRGGSAHSTQNNNLFSFADKTLYYDACTGCASFSRSALSVCPAIWSCTRLCPPRFVPSLLLLSPCRAEFAGLDAIETGASFGRWSRQWKKSVPGIAYGVQNWRRDGEETETKEQGQTKGG